MASATLSPARRAALDALSADLQRVFGQRLQSICAYALENRNESDTHTIVFVDHLSFEDLAACVPYSKTWATKGLAVPLLLEEREFSRSLDVFPLEYGDIIAHHLVVYGADPFAGITVSEQDRRRGCELQAKSHLIHLREAYLETGGDPRAVGRMIAASAEGFRRLLENLVTLVRPAATHPAGHPDLANEAHALIGVPAALTREVLASVSSDGPSTIADPTSLLGRYVEAVQDIWEFVDAWKR
jgi:hypothetical protein